MPERELHLYDRGEIRFYEDKPNGTNYTALRGAASQSGVVSWSLPAADGSAGQFLQTDGAGGLSFASGTGVEIYNVKSAAYGAVGDVPDNPTPAQLTAATDDTSAIQAAIDAAELIGGVVYLPDGGYKTTSALVINSPFVRFEGAGKAKLYQANAASNVLEIQSTTDVSVKNIEFIGVGGDGETSSNNDNGVEIKSASVSSPAQGDCARINVEDCVFRDFRWNGVFAEFTDVLKIINCRIIGCRDGFSINACRDAELRGLYLNGSMLAEASTKQAATIGVYTGGINGNGHSGTFDHLQAENVRIIDCVIEDRDNQQAVLVHGGKRIVIDSLIIENSIAGIDLLPESTEQNADVMDVVVSNCVINLKTSGSPGSNPGNYGIQVGGRSTAPTKYTERVVITGCVITGGNKALDLSGGGGIMLQSYTRGVVITGCDVSNCTGIGIGTRGDKNESFSIGGGTRVRDVVAGTNQGAAFDFQTGEAAGVGVLSGSIDGVYIDSCVVGYGVHANDSPAKDLHLNSAIFHNVTTERVNRLADHRSGVFNVSAYGAEGNNLNDDRARIQAAIDAAAAATPAGAIVFFPPGTYRLAASLTLPDNVTLIGSGPRSTVLRGNNLVSDTLLEADDTGATTTGVKVQGIGFDNGSEGNTGAVGLDITRFQHCRIEDCRFSNVETGIKGDSSSGDTRHNRLLNLEFSTCANGIDVEDFDSSEIVGGYLTDVNTGIALDGASYVRVSGVSLKLKTGETGISVGGSVASERVTIEDVWIEGTSSAGTGINVGGNSTQTRIIRPSYTLLGTNISDSGTNTITIDDSITAINGTFSGNVSVTGDVVVSKDLSLGAPESHTIASGAITVTGSYATVAGEGAAPDQLDTINGGQDGMVLVLRRDTDNITVAHNTGNILLDSSANCALANDQHRIFLIYDAGLAKWCEISRQD